MCIYLSTFTTIQSHAYTLLECYYLPKHSAGSRRLQQLQGRSNILGYWRGHNQRQRRTFHAKCWTTSCCCGLWTHSANRVRLGYYKTRTTMIEYESTGLSNICMICACYRFVVAPEAAAMPRSNTEGGENSHFMLGWALWVVLDRWNSKQLLINKDTVRLVWQTMKLIWWYSQYHELNAGPSWWYAYALFSLTNIWWPPSFGFLVQNCAN